MPKIKYLLPLLAALQTACSGWPQLPAMQKHWASRVPIHCPVPTEFRGSTPEAGSFTGIGFGKTEAAALSKAQESIAGQMYTDLDTDCTEQEQFRQQGKQTWSQSSQSCYSRAQSTAQLPDVQVVERVLCDQGIWVKAIYQDRSFSQQMAALQQPLLQGRAPWPWRLHPDWHLRATAGNVVPVLEVRAEKHFWHLRLGDQVRRVSTKNLVQQGLWPVLTAGRGNLDISLGGVAVNTVRLGEQFDIAATARQEEYISLFSIQQTGQVTLLTANNRLEAGTRKSWQVKTELQPQDDRCTDVWLALHHAKPLANGLFEDDWHQAQVVEDGLMALFKLAQQAATEDGEIRGAETSLEYRTLVVKR